MFVRGLYDGSRVANAAEEVRIDWFNIAVQICSLEQANVFEGSFDVSVQACRFATSLFTHIWA